MIHLYNGYLCLPPRMDITPFTQSCISELNLTNNETKLHFA